MLVVALKPRCLRQIVRQFQGKGFSWAYLGQDVSHFQLARQSFQADGIFIDTGRQFHQVAEKLREEYLALLYGLGSKINTLAWWVTSLSYRRREVSKTFQQACYLKIALDLAKNRSETAPLVLAVSDKPLRSAIQQNMANDAGFIISMIGAHRPSPMRPALDLLNLLTRRVFFVLRESRRLIESRLAMPRALVLSKPTTLIVHSVSQRNINLGPKFHSFVFGDLADKLTALGHHVAFMPLVLRQVQYKEALARVYGGSPLLVPHRYLGIWDIVGAVISTIRKPKIPRPIPTLGELDISSLFEDELRWHCVSNRAADTFLMAAMTRRWAALGIQINRVIYVYENQPWERAFCWGIRHNFPNATLIGYQHARVPRFMLSFHLDRGGEPEAPLPHYVVTVGQYTADILTSGGYRSDQVRVGGALHMQDLLTLRPDRRTTAEPADKAMVLFASSEGLEETVELAEMAARSFKKDDGVDVVLKCHPVNPYEKIARFLDSELPSHVSVSTEPIGDLIQRCSVMVYTGSTVCVQALALGVPVIHLRPQFDFDMDPLEAAPNARLEATGLEELRQQLRWLLDHKEEYVTRHRSDWTGLVAKYFGAVTEETIKAFAE